MLDKDTRSRIDTARDILVGKVPDPKSQVEQITIALIYKFMDDMDVEAEELGGKRTFFSGKYEQFAWSKLMSRELGGDRLISLYSEAIQKMDINPNIPQLFRDIFKNAYLPYRDPETLKLFLKEINKFNYDHSEKLGDAFEYLLSVLGSQGDAGQFRTPRHIIDFMVEIADPKKNETIIDPACGTAGFLISSYKHILKMNSSNYRPDKDVESFDLKGTDIRELPSGGIKRYSGDKLTPDDRSKLSKNIRGYDISPDMVRLSLVNLYLHGFSDPHIFEYDTLTSEEKWNEFGDVILANPPFMSPKGGIKPHKRFSVQSNRSEVLFVDYIAEHLAPAGRAAVIVPEGIIFQSGTAYKKLRKMLVDDYLFCVVSLPAGVFNPYSGVKTSILLMDRKLSRLTDNILFVKVNNDGYDLGAQRRPVENSDLPEALSIIREYKERLLNEDKGFKHESPLALVVPKTKIAENDDYNLTGERYRVSEVRKNQKWPMVKLGDICEIGSSKRVFESEWKKEGVPFYRAREIVKLAKDGYVENELFISEEMYSEYSKKYGFPQEGDLMVTGVGTLGICYQVKKNERFYFKDGNIIWLKKFHDDVISDYIRLLYKSSPLINQINVNAVGGTVGTYTITNANNTIIPFPPLEVQKEIVAEIEGYQRIIDGARQVVDNWKPRIDIDPDWPVVKLGEITSLITKGTTPTTNGYNFEKEGITFIKVESISEKGIIDEKKISFISNECHESLKRSQLKENDILFSIAGTEMGISSLVPKNVLPANTNQALSIIRLKYDVNPIYTLNYLRSINLKNQIERLKVGVAQFNLSLKQVSDIEIPLPPLDVQQEIVSRIESERKAVVGCRELIKVYEDKIKMVIDKVWEG